MSKFFKNIKQGIEDAIKYEKGELKLQSLSFEVSKPCIKDSVKKIN
jgi:hypothetical protein